jgi:hypothetical protein
MQTHEVFEDEDEWVLAAVRLPCGLRTARRPLAPAPKVRPELTGKVDRERNGPVADFLGELPDRTRVRLAQGQVVDLSPHAAAAARLLASAPMANAGQHSSVRGQRSVGYLSPVPELRVRPRPETAGGEVRVVLDPPPGWPTTLGLIQLDEAGDLGWSETHARSRLRPESAPQTWDDYSTQITDSRPTLRQVLEQVEGGLSDETGHVSLDDLSGYRLDEALTMMAEASGVPLRLSRAQDTWTIFSQGGEVPTRWALEALIVAGRLSVGARRPDGTLPLYRSVAAGHERVVAQRRAARHAPDPEVRNQLRALLLDHVTQCPVYDDLPLGLDRYLNWWSGGAADLAGDDANWLERRRKTWAHGWEQVPRRAWGWLIDAKPEKLRLDTRLGFNLVLASLDPVEPQADRRAELLALGADDSRPFYQARCAVVGFH